MPQSKYLPASDDFDLESYPLYWVARLNAKYSAEMEKKLKQVKMDVARWRVAVTLRYHGDLTISQIADHAIAKMPTMTKIVYRMQDEGLVSVRSSENDGRVCIVSITEKGIRNLEFVNDGTKNLFSRLFRNVTDEEIEVFNSTVKKMFGNLSDDW